MKKILIAVLALGLFAMIASSAQAEEKYVAGGFEMSGHIMTGLGIQHRNSKTPSYAVTDNDGVVYGPGTMGKYMGSPVGTPGIFAAANNRSNDFGFFVDGVELDIAKSFGENVRLRTDMIFGRVASSGAGTVAFTLEQAYATANIPVGNGIEFLVGRFNTPIGFEAADASQNDTISKSVLAEGLRPTNTTGLKIYYSFSDLVDLHFYVVNGLYTDTTVKESTIPSTGLRLGFNWGQEGTESTFGLSGFFGPESLKSNRHFTYGGDLDLNWWITESFALGAEAFMLRSGAVYKTGTVTGNATNQTIMAGLLNLHYVFSDVWDGTLKYVFAKQYQVVTGVWAAGVPGNFMNLTGDQQSMHQIALAGGYAIADGAKFKLEGRFDLIRPNVAGIVGAPGRSQYVFGGALAFAYDF